LPEGDDERVLIRRVQADGVEIGDLAGEVGAFFTPYNSAALGAAVAGVSTRR
jgi:hypothetical protein